MISSCCLSLKHSRIHTCAYGPWLLMYKKCIASYHDSKVASHWHLDFLQTVCTRPSANHNYKSMFKIWKKWTIFYWTNVKIPRLLQGIRILIKIRLFQPHWINVHFYVIFKTSFTPRPWDLCAIRYACYWIHASECELCKVTTQKY